MILQENTKQKINFPQDTAQIFYKILEAEHKTDQGKEHWWVVGLGSDNTIKYVELVGLGLNNMAMVAPRETFRLAIMKNVNSIICAHNHPTGDTRPSKADTKTTDQLKEAGKILGIKLLDSMIIGDNEYFSFLEKGLI